jgi:phage baseplate assembly protein W
MATLSKTYSFKSAGATLDSVASNQVAVEPPPIGIRTPMNLGSGTDGLFAMHHRLDDNIADNLRNLLLTNRGERLLDYNFGANLREMVFELGTEEGDAEAIRRISNAISTYMPFLSPDTFESFIETQDENSPQKVGIRVSYTVTGYENKPRQIEVMLSTVS